MKKMEMKKWTVLLCAGLMGISMLAGCGKTKETAGTTVENRGSEQAVETDTQAASNELDTIKSRGKLIIATSGNFRPLTYADDNGELTGFDIELGTILQKRWA